MSAMHRADNEMEGGGYFHLESNCFPMATQRFQSNAFERLVLAVGKPFCAWLTFSTLLTVVCRSCRDFAIYRLVVVKVLLGEPEQSGEYSE